MYVRAWFYTILLCSGSLLGACGQKGDLYLPSEPEAAHRATLPQTLIPPASKAPSSAVQNQP